MPPLTLALCYTTRRARRTPRARFAFVALNVSVEPYELFSALRTSCVS